MRNIFGELPETLPFWHPAVLIATWFGAGLLPIGPGTWGSAAALPFGWALMVLGGPMLLAVAIAVVFAAGWWAADVFVRELKADDPPEVVVDEVVAQWLVLTITPLTIEGYLSAFLLFRFFDTFKILPASWIDEQVSGAAGVMLDDFVAGLFAFAGMAAVLYVQSL